MALEPPLAVWSEYDHSGPVIIVTAICMFYWLIPGIVQQVISFVRRSGFKWADRFFAASMVCGVVQSSLLLSACHHGLGKSKAVLEPEDVLQARRLYHGSNILFVLTLGVVKSASAFFVCNLTVKDAGSLRHAPRRQRWTLYGTLALVFAWSTYAMIWLALSCNGHAYCTGTVGRWLGVFVGDALTDLTIALFAATVIWPTRATIRTRLLWYLPFLLRLLLPLLSGLRLLTLDPASLENDPTLAIWLFVVLGQIQLLLSILAGATPALKKTMLDLITNYGALTESHSGSRAAHDGSNSFPLRYVGGVSNAHITSQGSSARVNKIASLIGGIKGPAIPGKSHEYHREGDGDSQEGIVRQEEFEVRYSENDHVSASEQR